MEKWIETEGPKPDYKLLCVRLSDELEHFRACNADLTRQLAEATKERDQAIELMSMRYENLNRNGKTILDFQSVWISQSRRRIEKLELELAEAREAIWLNHGCQGLYGDDGEMQCSNCMIDFKRDHIGKIVSVLSKMRVKLSEAREEIARLKRDKFICAADLVIDPIIDGLKADVARLRKALMHIVGAYENPSLTDSSDLYQIAKAALEASDEG